MNAIELSEKLHIEWRDDSLNYDTALEASFMLRRQHEAILKLREALKEMQRYVFKLGAEYAVAEKALIDTKDFEMIDTKAIREVASVTPDSERMQFKPSTVIALLDSLEAAEKDAARYRWLRDTGDETWIPLKSRLRGSNKAEAHIDTAIAAMKEQK